ncbi:MAG: hypothetical protein WED05_00470 [Candidatus Atabeyarchaeum deiterrae]
MGDQNQLTQKLISTCYLGWSPEEGHKWLTCKLFEPKNRELLEGLTKNLEGKAITCDWIIGVETSGIPLAVRVAQKLRKPFSISRMFLPIVRPEPRPAGKPPSPLNRVLVFDDIVSTGYKLFLANKMVERLLEKSKSVELVALVSLPVTIVDPLKGQMGQENATTFLKGIDRVFGDLELEQGKQELKKASVECPSTPTRSEASRDSTTILKKLKDRCLIWEKDKAVALRSWEIFADADGFSDVCSLLAYECYEEDCNAVASISTYGLPFAAEVSYKLSIPLTYSIEYKEPYSFKIRPEDLNGCKRLYLVDTLARTGRKLQKACSLIPRDLPIVFKPIFGVSDHQKEKIIQEIKEERSSAEMLKPLVEVPTAYDSRDPSV